MDFQLFKNRNEWRTWLELNHKTEMEIWLGYYKKHTGKPSVRYDEAVEEALCFGWIDSKVNRVDNNIYKQKYTPRKKNSVWSLLNVKRVEKMIKEGRMTKAGMEKVEEGKESGTWQIAYSSKKEEVVPEDLLQALKINKTAFTHFFNYTVSIRNRYIYWINRAKQQETRDKRIEKVVGFAEGNVKPGF